MIERMRNGRSLAQTGRKLVGVLLAGTFLVAASATRAQDEGSRTPESGIEAVRIQVDGIACPFCAFNIEKRLLHLAGVKGADQIHTSVVEGHVTLEWAPQEVFDPESANEQIRRAGFTPNEIVLQASGSVTRQNDREPLLLHLAASGQKVEIAAAEDSDEAGPFAELDSALRERGQKEPFAVHVEGTVRQLEDSWQILLRQWEPRS